MTAKIIVLVAKSTANLPPTSGKRASASKATAYAVRRAFTSP